MSTTKSRRELFEEQLKDLQKDISSLSQKLAIPTIITTNRLGSSPSAAVDSSRLDSSVLGAKHDLSTSIISAQDSREQGSKDVFLRQQLEQLSNDLTKAYKERDEAKRRVEQLTQENEELRKGLPEFARLKTSYDSLKQDHEALKISLESCERIRMQQKELIQVLQRSNAMMSESSAASVHSISSISHRGENSTVHSLVPVVGGFQPPLPQPVSVLSGSTDQQRDNRIPADTPQWVYTSSLAASPTSRPLKQPSSSQQGYARPPIPPKSMTSGVLTAVKRARMANAVASNSATRKKATSAVGSSGPIAGKKSKKSNKKAAAAAYQRITNSLVEQSPLPDNTYENIMRKNVSLVSSNSKATLSSSNTNQALANDAATLTTLSTVATPVHSSHALSYQISPEAQAILQQYQQSNLPHNTSYASNSNSISVLSQVGSVSSTPYSTVIPNNGPHLGNASSHHAYSSDISNNHSPSLAEKYDIFAAPQHILHQLLPPAPQAHVGEHTTGRPPRYPSPTVKLTRSSSAPSPSNARAVSAGIPSRASNQLTASTPASNSPSNSRKGSHIVFTPSPSASAKKGSSTKTKRKSSPAVKAALGEDGPSHGGNGGAGSRILYRPIPSPSTTFGTSTRRLT